MDLVIGWSRMPAYRKYYDNYRIVSERTATYVCDLTRREGIYLLKIRINNEVAISLYSYCAYAVSRGCNIQKSMKILLVLHDSLSSQFLRINNVCAWIVQFSCDTGSAIELDED